MSNADTYRKIGPIPATKTALKKAGLTIDQMGLYEVNEVGSALLLLIEIYELIPPLLHEFHRRSPPYRCLG